MSLNLTSIFYRAGVFCLLAPPKLLQLPEIMFRNTEILHHRKWVSSIFMTLLSTQNSLLSIYVRLLQNPIPIAILNLISMISFHSFISYFHSCLFFSCKIYKVRDGNILEEVGTGVTSIATKVRCISQTLLSTRCQIIGSMMCGWLSKFLMNANIIRRWVTLAKRAGARWPEAIHSPETVVIRTWEVIINLEGPTILSVIPIHTISMTIGAMISPSKYLAVSRCYFGTF